MVRYLLDTNTASYVIKGNIPGVRERLVKLPMADIAISAVTEGELRFGAARKPEASRLKLAVEEFLLRVESLPWDSAAAQQYAQVRATLESTGESLGSLDTMIAAHALSVQAVLVTNDRAFRRVKNLKLQDWSRT
jgi:tRNA(fMet)-specific endonuclease VapC